MSISRLHRLILAIYPERFRHRYGDELASVAADCGGGWRVTFDLAVAAVKARLNPDPITPGSDRLRLRLESTTNTVFGLWAWSAIAVALFAWAVQNQEKSPPACRCPSTRQARCGSGPLMRCQIAMS